MKRRLPCLSLILALAAPVAVVGPSTAQAENSWAAQQARNAEMTRQALQQQAQQGPSMQVQQYERWKQEWVQQHPNEPIPILPVLEKMHRGETLNNINNGFAQMRARRQEELRQQRAMSRQRQEQQLAAQHITWTPQQWQNWDREYDAQMKQRADEYLEAVRQAGEMEREEQRRKAMGF